MSLRGYEESYNSWKELSDRNWAKVDEVAYLNRRIEEDRNRLFNNYENEKRERERQERERQERERQEREHQEWERNERERQEREHKEWECKERERQERERKEREHQEWLASEEGKRWYAEKTQQLQKRREELKKYCACIYLAGGSAPHIVGLRTDGTVVAVGMKDKSQCNTYKDRQSVA
jgi:hypothetical protein